MKLKLLYVLFLISFINGRGFASHIVGGELNYRHLGGWNYEVRLTVYRDCWHGIPPFEDPAFLAVYRSNNSMITSYPMTFLGSDTLVASINDACYTPPLDFCYEVTTYIDTFNFPPIPGGYQIVYEICCRNDAISNIQDPGNVGAAFYATIPDTAVVQNNSNPVFKNWPPPFLCADKPLSFDHSATDADGDSLVYELNTPFVDNTFSGGPPFGFVTFIPPYSTSNMMGGVQPLKIDSVTGLLTVIPDDTAHFVTGIKVKEYRNGILIGETKRDYQFIVKECPKIVNAAAIAPSDCSAREVTFSNLSTGASSYAWSFGDPGSTEDVSSEVSPTYSYHTSGTYNVTLVAYSSVNSVCTDTAYEILTCVFPDDCDVADIFVPNTFSPNGDSKNDILFVRGNQITELYFAVYNSYGQMVFETTDLTKGWDGIFKDKKADPSVFAWHLRAKCFSGEELKKKGNVTLIR